MLPQPNEGFAWVQLPGGPALVCQALEPVATHFYTTREWRLGFGGAEQRDEAWGDVAGAAHVEPVRLARVTQVHGADVVVLRSGAARGSDTDRRREADIIVSNNRELTLAIQTADCVPLLLGDCRTGAVAAAHAGWRGLASHVPRMAVEALAREFGSRPSDLVAAIGPSIGACCYEVGADVRDAFRNGGFEREIGDWFFDAPRPTRENPSMLALSPDRRLGHWFFDGWAAAYDQLLRAGVPLGQIHSAGLCTASHPALCSYRRDGAASGRIAAAITPR